MSRHLSPEAPKLSCSRRAKTFVSLSSVETGHTGLSRHQPRWAEGNIHSPSSAPHPTTCPVGGLVAGPPGLMTEVPGRYQQQIS